MLACGTISALLYVATDIIGGLRYDGYRFTSQTISELMAVGAPSKPLVDPLFLIYNVLVLAFGVGVFREGAGRSRALRVTGALLITYAALGFTGPIWFPLRAPRGLGSLAADVPHIVLTGVLVLLLLFAFGVGAFALGIRFRVYSFATVATVIALGALSGVYGARLAADMPTPGLGIIERIDVYACLLWTAVLGVALLQRRPSANYAAASVAGS
jgi:hypothetical membrane protein